MLVMVFFTFMRLVVVIVVIAVVVIPVIAVALVTRVFTVERDAVGCAQVCVRNADVAPVACGGEAQPMGGGLIIGISQLVHCAVFVSVLVVIMIFVVLAVVLLAVMVFVHF